MTDRPDGIGTLENEMTIKISNTAIQTTIASAKKCGNNQSEYYFFSGEAFCDVTIEKSGKEVKLQSVAQAGQSYYHGDYSLPSETLGYSAGGGCSEFLVKINEMLESDFDDLDAEDYEDLKSELGLDVAVDDLLKIYVYLSDLLDDLQTMWHDATENKGRAHIDECEADILREREYQESM